MLGKFHAKKLLAGSNDGKGGPDALSEAISALCAFSKLDTEAVISAQAWAIAVQILIRDPLRICEHRAAVDREIERLFELRAKMADPAVKAAVKAHRDGK